MIKNDKSGFVSAKVEDHCYAEPMMANLDSADKVSFSSIEKRAGIRAPFTAIAVLRAQS